MNTNPSVLFLYDHYDERIVRGISRYAQSEGWQFTPINFATHALPFGWKADGILTRFEGSPPKNVIDSSIPRVDLSPNSSCDTLPRVEENFDEIGRMAANYFMDRGFRHFIFYHWGNTRSSVGIEQGFQSALLADERVQNDLRLIEHPQLNDFCSSGELQQYLLDKLADIPRPFATLIPNDELAALFVDTCLELAMAVPDDVAVLSVGNAETLCSSLGIPLSSVDTNLEPLGYLAAKKLDQVMQGSSSKHAKTSVEPFGVIERQSTDILAISHPGVRNAIIYMQEHFNEAFTMDDLAQAVGFSKRGLEKAFQQVLNITPSVMLRSIRIQKAKNLLTKTDMKTASIAHECGYSSSSNLSLAFKRATQMTPNAYRLQYGLK